jgi:hypothetical protein
MFFMSARPSALKGEPALFFGGDSPDGHAAIAADFILDVPRLSCIMLGARRDPYGAENVLYEPEIRPLSLALDRVEVKRWPLSRHILEHLRAHFGDLLRSEPMI